VVLLAIAATIILVVGWLTRPRELPQAPTPVPSTTELEQLARRAERRALDSRTDYVAAVAGDIAPSLVRVPPIRATGVVWDATRVVVPTMPFGPDPAPLSVSISSQAVSLQPAIRGTHVPFAVLAAAPKSSALEAVTRAQSMPEAGEPVVTLWRTDTDFAFVTGFYGQLASAMCGTVPVQEVVSSIFHSPAMVGGGLFGLDGELVGVLLPCNGRIAAIAATSIAEMLSREGVPARRLLARFGFGIAVDESRPTFGGVFVNEVWNGSAADRAGLRPGDVITAVNGVAAGHVDALHALLEPQTASSTLRVRRQSHDLEVAFGEEVLPQADARADALGVVWEAEQGTYRVASVVPGGRAATAGLQAGDRLLRIDHVAPRDLRHLARMLTDRSTRPTLLEVERGARRLAVVVR
jgi:hypothetical protein